MHNAKLFRGLESKFLPKQISYSSDFPLVRTGEVYFIYEPRNYILSLYPFILLEICPKCNLEKIFIYRKYQNRTFHYKDYEYGHSYTSEECFERFYKDIFGNN